MNKAELEKKPLSDLHTLAAEAGIEKFRMLTKAELVEKLSGGNGGGQQKPQRRGSEERSGRSAAEDRPERPRRRRRSRSTGSPAVADEDRKEEASGREEAPQ